MIQATVVQLDEFDELEEHARKERTTLFTVLFAAFHVLLFRYSGQTDLIVGTPAAQRDHPDLQDLVGYFLNTLPIRSAIAERTTFREFLQRFHDDCRVVEVTHRNFVRLVRDTNYVDLGPGVRILQVAPNSFDAATFEIWGALLNGGSAFCTGSERCRWKFCKANSRTSRSIACSSRPCFSTT